MAKYDGYTREELQIMRDNIAQQISRQTTELEAIQAAVDGCTADLAEIDNLLNA